MEGRRLRNYFAAECAAASLEPCQSCPATHASTARPRPVVVFFFFFLFFPAAFAACPLSSSCFLGRGKFARASTRPTLGPAPTHCQHLIPSGEIRCSPLFVFVMLCFRERVFTDSRGCGGGPAWSVRSRENKINHNKTSPQPTTAVARGGSNIRCYAWGQ